MKTKTKATLWQLATPLIFVIMVLMQAYFLNSAADRHPDMELTHRALSKVATPVYQIGLLGF